MKLLITSSNLSFYSAKTFAKLHNRNDYHQSINLFADISETDFKLRDLKLKLGQFSVLVDSKDVSIGKIFKILNDFWKPGVIKLSKFS